MATSDGIKMDGFRSVAAIVARRPPELTQATRHPRAAAAEYAASVSSVSPEKDTAMARVFGPQNAGGTYPLHTTIGTDTASENRERRKSPATPDPPMPNTATESIWATAESPGAAA